MIGAWRSPVAHVQGVHGVAGSNPVAPTIFIYYLFIVSKNFEPQMGHEAKKDTYSANLDLFQE